MLCEHELSVAISLSTSLISFVSKMLISGCWISAEGALIHGTRPVEDLTEI